MKPINATKMAVIMALWREGAHEDGECLLNYSGIYDGTAGSNKLAVKRAVRSLMREKFVRHTPAIDGDGRPSGSGFILTAEGKTRAEAYEEEEQRAEDTKTQPIFQL